MADSHDLLSRLKAAVGSNKPDELTFSPLIQPDKLNNAGAYAEFGAEMPLAIVDNTVWGSCKKGVLITDRAVYLSEPVLRIEIAEITTPPSPADGDNPGGVLSVGGDPVALPDLLEKKALDALHFMLEAIARSNRGEAAPVDNEPPVAGPVGHIALEHLQSEHIQLAPRIPREKLQNAAGRFGDWIDYAAGEEALAFVDETVMGSGKEATLLTDRRLLASMDDKHFVVPYAALQGVSLGSGFVTKKMSVNAGPYSCEIPLTNDAAPQVAAFLNALLALPPDHRQVAWTSPTSPEDPSGATRLLAQLSQLEPRAALLLRFIEEMTRRGQMPPDIGADFASRAALLHRTVTQGRGLSQTWRLSPLSSADFAYVLQTVFGQPLGHWPEPDRQTFDFATGGTGGVGAAAVSTAVGLSVMAVVGVGWYSVPKQNVRVVRLVLTDLPGSCGFIALGDAGPHFVPVVELAPELLDWIINALAGAEAQLLLFRTVFGWSASPAELYAQPPHLLQQQITGAIGPVDLSLFGAQQ